MQTPLSSWNTYSGHGIGNLDNPQAFDTPVYSICDGTVSYVLNPESRSSDAQGNTYCCIICPAEANNLGIEFKV